MTTSALNRRPLSSLHDTIEVALLILEYGMSAFSVFGDIEMMAPFDILDTLGRGYLKFWTTFTVPSLIFSCSLF